MTLEDALHIAYSDEYIGVDYAMDEMRLLGYDVEPYEKMLETATENQLDDDEFWLYARDEAFYALRRYDYELLMTAYGLVDRLPSQEITEIIQALKGAREQ